MNNHKCLFYLYLSNRLFKPSEKHPGQKISLTLIPHLFTNSLTSLGNIWTSQFNIYMFWEGVKQILKRKFTQTYQKTCQIHQQTAIFCHQWLYFKYKWLHMTTISKKSTVDPKFQLLSHAWFSEKDVGCAHSSVFEIIPLKNVFYFKPKL